MLAEELDDQRCETEKARDELKAMRLGSDNELYKTIHDLTEANEHMVSENKLLNDSLIYSKNKENKLMYLVFKLHKKGYPINDIYEKEVKPISTLRFNQEMLDEE